MRGTLGKTIFIFVFWSCWIAVSSGADNSKLDVRWRMISHSDSFITVQLSVRSDIPGGETLGNANFVFYYNDSVLEFAKNNFIGRKNIDCFWYNGFEPNDTSTSAVCSVTRIKYGQLSININLEPGFAVPISSDTSFTAVVNVKFKKLKKKGTTQLSFKMDKTKPPTFDNVFDDHFNAFDEGTGWDQPLIVKLD